MGARLVVPSNRSTGIPMVMANRRFWDSDIRVDSRLLCVHIGIEHHDESFASEYMCSDVTNSRNGWKRTELERSGLSVCGIEGAGRRPLSSFELDL